MGTHRILFAIVVATAGCSGGGGGGSAGPAAPASPAITSLAAFESRVEQVRQELNVPGLGVAVSRDDHLALSRGFGAADVRSSAPPTGKTSFHVASLTKTFAATLLLRLVEGGKVGLDDAVAIHGVAAGNPCGTVTVRHLVSHTSESCPPGSGFSYNGDRFQLVQGVIERAGGRTFGEQLVQDILTPLQLRQSAPNVLDSPNFALTGFDRAAFTANMARPYAWNGMANVETSYPGLFGAAAGLISSAEDIAAWSRALDRDVLLQASSRQLAFTNGKSTTGEEIPYGIGWFVQKVDGHTIAWHYGLWQANSSLLVKAPAKRLTLVVLANSDRLTSPYRLGDGDVMQHPLARDFIQAFVVGDAVIP